MSGFCRCLNPRPELGVSAFRDLKIRNALLPLVVDSEQNVNLGLSNDFVFADPRSEPRRPDAGKKVADLPERRVYRS